MPSCLVKVMVIRQGLMFWVCMVKRLGRAKLERRWHSRDVRKRWWVFDLLAQSMTCPIGST